MAFPDLYLIRDYISIGESYKFYYSQTNIPLPIERTTAPHAQPLWVCHASTEKNTSFATQSFAC